MKKTKEYELGQLLSYEQPTEFIVNSTEYNDSYNIPVLTAGKSFIIGYTNETDGVYSNYPVIIFDDFTTSSQYVDFPFKVKSSAMKILSVNKELADLKYLYLLMQTIEFNAANHKRYWISEYSKLKIDLPPLEEQRRIVKRIESLFAKLDAAKEKAQNVVDSFEVRKAAVLHKAFNGELKIENEELSLNDWKDVSLGDVVTGFKYGIADKCDYNNKGIPVLRIPNIGDSNIDFSDIKYSSNKNIDENYLVKKNDILIIRSNGSRDLVGKSALFEVENEKFSYGSFLIKITPTELILPKYLVLFLNSNDARFQMFYKAKSSSGIHNINSRELAAIKLKLPPINYQLSIIDFLDKVFQKERAAKKAAQTVLEQIDLLKKSILARAFRGEL